MHNLVAQTRQGSENGGWGVSLSDFQNTRPLPLASAPEPMDAKDWPRDTKRKLNTFGCNNKEKLRYATYLLSAPWNLGSHRFVKRGPPELSALEMGHSIASYGWANPVIGTHMAHQHPYP
jgi:hypothetical protein